MLRYICIIAMMALVVFGEGVEERKSPCPGSFDYVKQEKEVAGQWEGQLTLNSEFKLHGVWIRVFFDRPIKKISSPDGLVDVHHTDDDAKNFLLKNRDFVLKKNEPTKVTFIVEYEGSEVPALVGYRLNARDVCPKDDE